MKRLVFHSLLCYLLQTVHSAVCFYGTVQDFNGNDLPAPNLPQPMFIGANTQSDTALDAMCCSFCALEPKCEYWARESSTGMSNPVKCWLKANFTGFKSVTDRRGNFHQLAPNSSTDVCGKVSENNPLTLTAATGRIIDQVVFASFGNPAGDCNTFGYGTKHASNATSIAYNLCNGKTTCTLQATNAVWSDTWSGSSKTLAIQMSTYPATSVCGVTRADVGFVSLSVPTGYYFSKVNFANLGNTITGTCGNFARSGCYASTTVLYNKITELCINKTVCTLVNFLTIFSIADPCPTTNEYFAIELEKADVDECAVNNGGCDPLVQCTNLPGTFSCAPCPSGYSQTNTPQNGTICTDNNECFTTNGGCPSDSTCINQFGGYLCTPYLVSGSLHITPGNPNKNNITLPDSKGGQTLVMTVNRGTYSLTMLQSLNVTLSYGPPSSPLHMKCLDSEWSVVDSTTYSVSCDIGAGAGSSYHFSLTACADNMTWGPPKNSAFICITSIDNISTFAYPFPTIADGTLRAPPSPPQISTGISILAAPNNLGTLLNFQGTNFVNDSTLLSVYYGPSNQTDQFQCELLSTTTDTSIDCRTQVGAFGENLIFTIVVSGYSISGRDNYNYKSIPSLTKVSGCDTDTINGTTMCPTEGGVPILVTGTSFLVPVGVFVEGLSCALIPPNTVNSITCVLPRGTGLSQNIFVSSTDQFSPPLPLISYAPPVITSLKASGCVSSSLDSVTLSDCGRDGGQLLIIQGSNFGFEGGNVLISNKPCTPLIHSSTDPHHLMTCTIPNGSTLNAAVLVLQGGQFSAAGPTLSYLQCEEGTYQEELNCLQCQIGTYSSQIGATVCTNCSAGSFSNRTAAKSCEQCPEGKASNWNGQSDCVGCTPGLYNPSRGQLLCAKCPLGTYSNRSNASSCTNCGSGNYSDIEGATECKQCAVGSAVSFPGSQKICPDCPIGYYAPVKGLSTCTACPENTFQDRPGQNTCNSCPGGRFSTLGATECFPCPSGSITVPVTNIPNSTNATSNSTNSSTVADIRNSSCLSCVNNAVSNDDRTQCLCPIGKYGKTNSSNPIPRCYNCPVGIVCETEGVVYEELYVASGWWRPNNLANESLTLVQCLHPTYCLGGLNSSCIAHRTGPICQNCEPGYQPNTKGSGECNACPSVSLAIGITFVISLIVLIGLILMFYLIVRSDPVNTEDGGRKQTGSISAMTTGTINGETNGKTDALVYGNEGWYTTPEFVAVVGENEHIATPRTTMTTELRVRKNPLYTLKIILGFLQISTNLTFIVTIPWPRTYRSVMSAINFINIDFVPWQSVGCAVNVTYYDQLLVVTLTPPIIILILCLIFILPVYLRDKKDFLDSNRLREMNKHRRHQLWKLVLFTVFLTYPLISSLVLSFFHCYTVQSVSYLVYDFSLLCYDGLWFRYLPLAVVMLIVYPLGIPVAILIVLLKYRHKLHKEGTRSWLGFLYEAYHIDQWWFELVDMLHKLFLTSILRFVAPLYQLPTGMVVITLYLMFILVFEPYVRYWNDKFHLLAQLYLFLILLAAHLQQTVNLTDAWTDIVLSFFLLAISLILFSVCIIEIILTFRSMFRKYQRDQAARLSLREEMSNSQIGKSVSKQRGISVSEMSDMSNTAQMSFLQQREGVDQGIPRESSEPLGFGSELRSSESTMSLGDRRHEGEN